MRGKGFREWVKGEGYGRRNKVEATFSRLKRIFGDMVRARGWDGRERGIGVRIMDLEGDDEDGRWYDGDGGKLEGKGYRCLDK